MRQRSRWHQSSREREAPSHRGPSGPAACDVSFAGVLCMPCMAWSRRRGAVWQCSGSVPCGLRSAVVIRTTRSFSFQKADMKPAADSGPNDHAHRARTDTARGGRVQRAGARTQTRYDTRTTRPRAPPRTAACISYTQSLVLMHRTSQAVNVACLSASTLRLSPRLHTHLVEVSCQASYRSTCRPGHLTVSLTETYPGAACRDYTCTAGAPTAPPRSRSYEPRYQ